MMQKFCSRIAYARLLNFVPEIVIFKKYFATKFCSAVWFSRYEKFFFNFATFLKVLNIAVANKEQRQGKRFGLIHHLRNFIDPSMKNKSFFLPDDTSSGIFAFNKIEITLIDEVFWWICCLFGFSLVITGIWNCSKSMLIWQNHWHEKSENIFTVNYCTN